MARYLPLCALEIVHEFFESSDDVRDLALQVFASVETQALMAREGLLLRERATGFEIWQEQASDPGMARESVLPLHFSICTTNPRLPFLTVRDAEQLACFVNDAAAVTEVEDLQSVASSDAMDLGLRRFERAACIELVHVKLAHVIQTGKDGMRRYRVQLKARRLHWKYIFSGALAKRALAIVDLNRSESGGVQFVPSDQVVTSKHVAFISDAALTMRSIPSQGFQLREEDASGRVLMRRLPNASLDHLGKERSPDGQSLVVAEIYVHQ
ncbi:MAG: hypothetical protein HY253_04335 [Burkholderiales bacterium]|nr:hypothetical protein [Burkholderiales bacterium]